MPVPLTQDELVAEVINAADDGDGARIARAVTSLVVANNPKYAAASVLINVALSRVLARADSEGNGGGLLTRLFSRWF